MNSRSLDETSGAFIPDRRFLLFSVALAIAALVYIMVFGVNIPYWDDWDFVNLLKAYDSGGHWLDKLYAQHNEHRFLFPKLVLLVLAKLTAWNVKAEMVLDWVISCGSFYIIWLLVKRSVANKSVYLLLVPCFYFNVGQWENMLWGCQVTLYMMLFSVIAAIYLLSGLSKSPLNIIPATLAGGVASFSFMNGLLVWPVGLLQILLTPVTASKKWTYSVIWLSSGAAVLALYFHGYVSPRQHQSILVSLHEPLNLAMYFFANAGAMLGMGTVVPSIASGIALVVAFIMFVYIHAVNNDIALIAPWLSLGLFSIISSSAIAAGRLGFGIHQSLVPRYTTITVLLIIAVLVLGSNAHARGYLDFGQVQLRYLSVAFMTVLIVGVASYYAFGLIWGYKQYNIRTVARHYLLSYKTAPDYGLSTIHPSPEKVRDWAGYLEEKKLSVFK